MQLFRDAIRQISVGASEDFDGVRITPVYIQEAEPLTGYRDFDTLFDQGLVEASEVSDSGVVGRIAVLNRSQWSLCLFDGEALVGAKQNRIVERSLIISPHAEVSVPVNCVERGRWSGIGGRGHFEKSDFAATPSMRMTKAQMMKEGRIGAIQSEVWACVDQVAACHDVRSSSDDLGEIYERAGQSDTGAITDYIDYSVCHGFIVEGLRRPFLEIFCDTEFCQRYAKKAVKGWMSERAGSAFSKSPLDAGKCLSRLKTCTWREDETYGSEKSWIPDDKNNGRLIQSREGHLVHMFLDLG